MPRLRRPPRPEVRVKVVKPPVPLHRRILGRGATEIDTIDDLRVELEKAYSLDLIEYDTYLDCHEALDVRLSKAKADLDKATGRYVNPEKFTSINLKRRPQRKYQGWQVKFFCVVCFLIIWKFMSFKP